MKIKATKKEIMNGFDYLIKIGYCDLQNLLNYEKENFYTTRREGWGADVYDLSEIVGQNVAIVTGYSPFGNIKPDYKLVKKYNNKAQEILYNQKIGEFSKTKRKLRTLIKKFINEVLRNDTIN